MKIFKLRWNYQELQEIFDKFGMVISGKSREISFTTSGEITPNTFVGLSRSVNSELAN